MKFRARLDDAVSITRLSNVVATLAKNVKVCVLRLSAGKVCFVISGKGSINMWCELNQSKFFSEYRIEGRDEHNEIFLEVQMEQLARTLRNTSTALSVKMKLTKHNGAHLLIDIIQATVTGGNRNVVHEVPVNIVPQRLWPDYQEPDMPDIDVSIFLPPLKQVKTIIDRMKSLDNYITLSANMSGELNIRIETSTVTATTYFKNLMNHKFCDDDELDKTVMYEARVDIKKLSHVLTGHFNPIKVICNIVDGCGLQFFLLHQEVSLQYYIPAIS